MLSPLPEGNKVTDEQRQQMWTGPLFEAGDETGKRARKNHFVTLTFLCLFPNERENVSVKMKLGLEPCSFQCSQLSNYQKISLIPLSYKPQLWRS